MLRIIGILALYIMLQGQAFSQTNYIREGRDGIYQIYLGEAVFGREQATFSNVRKYGFLRPFSVAEDEKTASEGKSHIYLGPFLGQETAAWVLEKVRKLGYPKAYIEGDEVNMTNSEGVDLTYSVQIGAYEYIDAARFAKFANQPARGIVILREDGLFKLLAGLYPASSEEYLKKDAVSYWKEVVGVRAFVRPFRR